MRNIDENTVTEAALEQMSSTPDPRLRQIMAAVVRHLHQMAREVDLTADEWFQAISFLTAVGQKCSANRQEFVLLSDVLGFSSLINSLNDKRNAASTSSMETETKSSLLGPFYRQNSPRVELGQSIAAKTTGHEIAVYGRITNGNGEAIPNASVQVWQTDEGGLYDSQREDGSQMDMRGTLHTDSEGRYWFRTVRPHSYSIPMDGPVGDLVRAQKRHGMRPAHIHFLIGAPGYRELVTALYTLGDEYLETDTVFGVTASLVISPKEKDAASPFPNLPSVRFDFTLAEAAGQVASGRVGVDAAEITKRVVETVR